MFFRYLLLFSLFLSVSVGVSAAEGQSKAEVQQPIPPTSTAPTWSAWPGEGAPLRGSGIDTKWVASWRYVDTELERPRWRLTLNYRLHRRFQLGVEYNPVAKEVSPLFNLFLFTETAQRPALFLGTSSDRIGSPAGEQAYFLTATKRLTPIPISAYATINYSEWDNNFNYPFGVSVDFGKGFSVRPMYDGDRFHLMFNYFQSQVGASLMYVWFEKFGIAMSTAF